MKYHQTENGAQSKATLKTIDDTIERLCDAGANRTGCRIGITNCRVSTYCQIASECLRRGRFNIRIIITAPVAAILCTAAPYPQMNQSSVNNLTMFSKHIPYYQFTILVFCYHHLASSGHPHHKLYMLQANHFNVSTLTSQKLQSGSIHPSHCMTHDKEIITASAGPICYFPQTMQISIATV